MQTDRDVDGALIRRFGKMRRLSVVWLPWVALLAVGCPHGNDPELMTSPPEVDSPNMEMKAPVSVPQLIPDETPPPAPAKRLSAEELTLDLYRRGLLVEIFFDFDRSELSERARAGLEQNARYLRQRPASLLIEGHCDERGTDEYNLALGHHRAVAARDYLVRLGVDGGRLGTITYGEGRGVCVESSEGCWARNRRAYFRLRE